MAEKTNVLRAMEVFWTRDDTDASNVAAMEKPFVPGMETAGNRRPGRRYRSTVKGKKVSEVKAEVPSKQPLIENLSTSTSQQNHHSNLASHAMPSMKTNSSKASLKDLCAEDKKRVANLIRELARLGDEKENMTHQLQQERKSFESEIHDLANQQGNILQERESVQKQLLDCQSLLAKYQEQLTEQLEKLTIQKDEQHMLSKKSPGPSRKSRKHQDASNSAPSRNSYPQNMDEAKYVPLPRQHTNFDAKSEVVFNPAGTRDNQPLSLDPSHNNLVQMDPCNPGVLPSVPHCCHQSVPSCSCHFPQQQPQTQWPQVMQPRLHPAHSVHPPLVQEQVTDTHMLPIEMPFADLKTGLGAPDDENNSDRPFTTMIDQLIAEERKKTDFLASDHVSQAHNLFDEAVRGVGKSSDQRSSLGTGPLDEPVMSSTQRSEYEKRAAAHQRTEHFRPLHSDDSFKEPMGLPHNGLMQQEGGVEPSDQPVISERKKQLLQQKELLLMEQERLKAVLSKQEKMLESKQLQLHHQQALQQRRLIYFQRSGFFPPPEWDGYSLPLKAVHFAQGTKTCGGSPQLVDPPAVTRVSVATSPLCHPTTNANRRSASRENHRLDGHNYTQQGTSPPIMMTTPPRHVPPLSDAFSGERAAGLLDIVDEVESEHNTSYEALPRHVSQPSRLSGPIAGTSRPRTQPPIHTMYAQEKKEHDTWSPQLYEQEHSDGEVEEEQESRVLEDVFFIR